MRYAHLNTTTNFTFLTGASHPREYVERAAELGYDAIAIADECSLAGVVKAFVAAQELNFKLIIGSRFRVSNGMHLLAIAPTRVAYSELSGFITLARRRMEKGEYEAHFSDLRFRLQTCLIIWLGDVHYKFDSSFIDELCLGFKDRLWIGIDHQLRGGEQEDFERWLLLSKKRGVPLVACGLALMHDRNLKPLQDVVSSIRENTPLKNMGTRLISNGEAYLKSYEQLAKLYPESLLHESTVIADLCTFSMAELRYEYPQELVPNGVTPIEHLRALVEKGKRKRWPNEIPLDVDQLLEKEFHLIEDLNYEFYFLTVHDIVAFARSQDILCQGRGSAANSVVCYCLFITEIAPGQINVLFERFISKERDEPPDIDVDFEHERREEVIQYIYKKYGRERAAIAAAVNTYHSRSSVRDVGKALGMELSLIDHMVNQIAWWDKNGELEKRIEEGGLKTEDKLMQMLFRLLKQINRFPRHLSQHSGGFVISQNRLSDLVPIENASMPDRTVIQWDKEDLEAMRLLKVDVLSLGMLTAIKKAMTYINQYDPSFKGLESIPREDPATYEMLCKGDSVGVFQIESRAQIAMLPRLQPRCFYDLVIEIAIVRPGPIQGQMVHPFLQRRCGDAPVEYESAEIEEILKPTLGVPIFQEQVMRVAMVAAGFSGGEADQLRRAITNWGKNSKLLLFEDRFIEGFLRNGYTSEFAHGMFEKVKGFGGYGFPESHSASFALLCYASSWIKCHHPAALTIALLNSQPMGFYKPPQLISDARRHGIKTRPVDINRSCYDNTLDKSTNGWDIRLGFRVIKGLNTERAKLIEVWRGDKDFLTITELSRRSKLSAADLECLASADVLRSIAGHRHEALWQAAAVKPHIELFNDAESSVQDDLLTEAPSLAKDVVDDYQTVGLSLKAHPMELLRDKFPFHRCKKKADLVNLRNNGFVCVGGLVTCMQRPGTAKGILFITLEDETGDMNVVVWASTQETFRKEILTGRLLLIKGTIEIVTENVAAPIIHVIAGNIKDYTHKLASLAFKTKKFQ